MSKLSDEDYRSIPLNATLALAALVVIVAGMKVGADLLVPLLLAVFIAVVCTSPVQWLHDWGLSRRTAAMLTLLVLLGFISLIGLLVVNSFGTFVEALPDIEARLYEHYWNLLNTLASHGMAIDPEQLSSVFAMEDDGSWVAMLLGELGSLFMQGTIVALLVIFMLFETLHFRDKVSRALENPAPSLKRFSEFSLTLKRYLAVKTVISLATGVLVWLSCLMVGVDFPLLWGCWLLPSTSFPTLALPWRPFLLSCCCWCLRMAACCRRSCWRRLTWPLTSFWAIWSSPGSWGRRWGYPPLWRFFLWWCGAGSSARRVCCSPWC